MNTSITRYTGLCFSCFSVSQKKSFSKTRFLSSNPNEPCDRIKLLRQEKEAGINSDINTQEIVAIADKLLEYKCIFTKQQNFFEVKCLN